MAGSEKIFAPPKHTWASWQAEYRKHIRVQVEWGRLGNVEVFQCWVDQQKKDSGLRVFLPWYKGGNSWRSGGRPHEVEFGLDPSVFVGPALLIVERFPQQFILLDGCHRVSEIKPQAVILDVIHPKRKKDLNLFSDALPHIFGLVKK